MVLQQQLTDERNARFLKLFKPVKADCERWVMHLAQDATVAEDMLQQAILMGLQSIHQLKNDIVFKAWMFRIIRNAFSAVHQDGEAGAGLSRSRDDGNVLAAGRRLGRPR